MYSFFAQRSQIHQFCRFILEKRKKLRVIFLKIGNWLNKSQGNLSEKNNIVTDFRACYICLYMCIVSEGWDVGGFRILCSI